MIVKCLTSLIVLLMILISCNVVDKPINTEE
jgi:hypothetical protein